MTNPTLTYFDAPVSRGEECRLALFIAGVSFTDERLKRPEWETKRAASPFGAVPYFSMEGHPVIGQSNAILRLVGRLHGLHPTDPWEAARHDGIMDAVEDLRHHMGPMARIKDEAEKKARREEAARDYLPTWAGYIERAIGPGPFVGGEKLQVADLKLFVVMGPYLKGSIDHVPATVFAVAPKLMALHAAVQKHPRVVAWYARAA